MTDKYIGKDLILQRLEVYIRDIDEWVWYDYLRIEVLSHDVRMNAYACEMKTGDAHDGNIITIQRYVLDTINWTDETEGGS